jgi:hypothetical protein
VFNAIGGIAMAGNRAWKGGKNISQFKVRAMVAQMSAINQSSAKGFEYFILSTSRKQNPTVSSRSRKAELCWKL